MYPAQNVYGALPAAPATCPDAKFESELVERVHAGTGAFFYLTLRHGVADADVQASPSGIEQTETILIDTIPENNYRLQPMLDPSPPLQKERASAQPTATKPLRIKSEELLGPCQEVIILHGGREYRLRRTQTGKLILTA